MTIITRLSENIYRIRHYQNEMPRESLLSKYRIINTAPDGEPTVISESACPIAKVGREEYTLEFLLDSKD